MAVGRSYAILFADRVIREDNGKYGCVGLFDQVNAQSVPFAALPWYIFVGLEGIGVGRHVITLNLVHDATQAVVVPVSIEVEQMGEGQVALPVPVVGVWFPQFGRYTLTVNVDGFQVGSRPLQVVNMQDTSDSQGGQK